MPSLEEIARIVQAIASRWSEENALGSRFRSQEARAFFHTRDVAATLWPGLTRVCASASLVPRATARPGHSGAHHQPRTDQERRTSFGIPGAGLRDWASCRLA